MTHITYSLKIALGWICWVIWSRNSGWIQDVHWLNNLLLPWDSELADLYEDWT